MQPIQSATQTSNVNNDANVPDSPRAASSQQTPLTVAAPQFNPTLVTTQDLNIQTAPPFQLSQTQSQLSQDPAQQSAALTTASQGLGGLLDSLDTGATSDQVNQLIKDSQDAAAKGDGLTAQKDMAQAQLLYSTMSTVLNMISQMQMEAIRNSKVQ
jgi:hypothetical protein